MRCTEGVAHIDVREARELPRKLVDVRLLFRVEAHILQHQDFARLQRVCGSPRLGANADRDGLHLGLKQRR